MKETVLFSWSNLPGQGLLLLLNTRKTRVTDRLAGH